MRYLIKALAIGGTFIVTAAIGFGAFSLLVGLLLHDTLRLFSSEDVAWVIVFACTVVCALIATPLVYRIELRWFHGRYRECSECRSYILIQATRCSRCGAVQPDGISRQHQ